MHTPPSCPSAPHTAPQSPLVAAPGQLQPQLLLDPWSCPLLMVIAYLLTYLLTYLYTPRYAAVVYVHMDAQALPLNNVARLVHVSMAGLVSTAYWQ